MKNRWFSVITLVIITALIATGCDVSKSEYDAIAVELNLVKEDRQALQTQLQEAQSQLTDAKTDTVKAQVELEIAQEQLERKKNDLETSQEQFETAKADLQMTQTQLQEAQSQLAVTNNNLKNMQAQLLSLQNDLDAARIVPDEALRYAEFMDILMYEVWMAAGVIPNFTISTAGEYQTALKNRATSIGDTQLISFAATIEAGPVSKNTLYGMCYYCLDKIETILK